MTTWTGPDRDHDSWEPRADEHQPHTYAPRRPTRAVEVAAPASAAEAWAALNREGPAADAVRSYLAPGPQPRYDTPQARDEARADLEAGQ